MKTKGVRGKGEKRKAVIDETDSEVVLNVLVPNNNNKRPKLDLDLGPLRPKEEDEEPDDEVQINQAPRRSPNGYILPDPLPKGLVIKDVRKNRWRIGKAIGLGGFGEIYSAALFDGTRFSKEDYVVKVEPHTNGPLFVELNFYCRAASSEQIDNYKESKNLKHLGIPDLKGSGSFIYRKKKLRFVVIPKYGTDIQSVLEESKSQTLSVQSASYIAHQIIDSFEYLHSKGYVHKDFKGANVLLSSTHNPKNGAFGDVFLVDYGLVSKFNYLGIHKPFEPDARTAHEGTLEYTSRDFHLGCVSRRGDIEVLIYVLIDWLGGKLPWDTDDPLKPPEIQRMKIEAFHDVRNFLHTTFKSGGPKCPSFIEDLMYSVIRTPFDQAPDYDYLRSLFVPYFRDLGLGHEHAIKHIDEEDQEVIITKPIGRRPSKRRCLSDFVKRQRDNSQPWTENRLDMYNESKKSILRQLSEESMTNPTPAMIEQLGKMKTRNTLPPVHSVRRRKGLVAKRRLEKSNHVRSEKALDGTNFLDNKDESSRSQKEENFLKIPTEDVRKSPRLRRESNRLKDFVQYINPLKLVKSIFSNPEE